MHELRHGPEGASGAAPRVEVCVPVPTGLLCGTAASDDFRSPGDGGRSREARSSPKMGVFVPRREERTSVLTFVFVFGDERSTDLWKVPARGASIDVCRTCPPHAEGHLSQLSSVRNL